MLPALDDSDRRILEVLQANADLSVNEIAEKVGLSASPCWRRIKRLEEAGVIRRRVALVDPGALDVNLNVFVLVKLNQHAQNRLPEFERAVTHLPFVLKVVTLSGDQDYLLHVVAPDTATFERFLRDTLLTLPFVQESHSYIALTMVKDVTALPVFLARVAR